MMKMPNLQDETEILPNDSNALKVLKMCQKSGLTQSQLSALTTVKQNTLCNWMQQKREPPSHDAELVRMKLENYFSDRDSELHEYYKSIYQLVNEP